MAEVERLQQIAVTVQILQRTALAYNKTGQSVVRAVQRDKLRICAEVKRCEGVP